MPQRTQTQAITAFVVCSGYLQLIPYVRWFAWYLSLDISNLVGDTVQLVFQMKVCICERLHFSKLINYSTSYICCYLSFIFNMFIQIVNVNCKWSLIISETTFKKKKKKCIDCSSHRLYAIVFLLFLNGIVEYFFHVCTFVLNDVK